jgi:hypothetical protein
MAAFNEYFQAADNLARWRPPELEANVIFERPRKRGKSPHTRAEQVMSEEWRARRRFQETKAGRWTDGTYRMNRMWAEFHWVLNFDEPDKTIWVASRQVTKVPEAIIWGALKFEA